jgi:hypothetical protein
MEMNNTNNHPHTHRDTISLYRCIYKSAQVGMGSLAKILEYCPQCPLKDTLYGQMRGYTAILRNAAGELARLGIRPTGMRAGEKLSACLLLKLSSMKKEGCVSRIAGMVILGTSMGSIEGAKKSSKFQNADENAKALLERMLRFEEANCRNLRSFL